MILVTGASGNTGRALAQQLVSMGMPVRAMVRDRAKTGDLEALGAEIVVADLNSVESLAPALVGITKAYLMTSADPQQVVLHSNFIGAAKRAGLRYIVRQSVRGAELRSPIKLARWHAISQDELEHSGIDWTHLQPVYNMQNFLRFAPTIKSRGAFHAPMKNAALSMVDARDVAAVAASVLIDSHPHRRKTYVITGPEPLTFADAAAQLSATLGKVVQYIDVSSDTVREAMLRMNVPEWYVDDLLGFYDFYSTGAGAVVSDVVAKVTGQPGRGFRQFVQDHQFAFVGSERARN